MLYEGGQTSEASTTSTSAVDLLTSGTLSIATGLPIMLFVAGRKDAGGAYKAAFGLKVNSTVISEAQITGDNSLMRFDGASGAESKYATATLGPRIANYERSTLGWVSGDTDGAVSEGSAPSEDADMPTATVTAIAIRGIVENAALTLSGDELHIYSYPIA